VNKFYKGVIVTSLCLVGLGIVFLSPKAEKETVELYKVTISHSSWTGKRRVRTEGFPTITIVDRRLEDLADEEEDYVTDEITVNSDLDEYAHFEVDDYVSRKLPNDKFTFTIKQITRRRRVK